MINVIDKKKYLNDKNYYETLDKNKLLEIIKLLEIEILEGWEIQRCCNCLNLDSNHQYIDNKPYCEECISDITEKLGCNYCEKYYTHCDLKKYIVVKISGRFSTTCENCIRGEIDGTISVIKDYKNYKNYDWYFHCFGCTPFIKSGHLFKFDLLKDRKFFNMITRFNDSHKLHSLGTYWSQHESSPQQVYNNVIVFYIHLRHQLIPKPICNMIISFYLIH